ncbi:conserved phage C-terminal domain-containing protein [Lactiplantibacillus plantarum]|uniref:conserved phage C-terminal domain-containing protein n=2 Tax=Lactiplantibacillus plantarum TaxID=1590 RepID=UPI0015DC3144|nr:conserved phage C-terminal domain-containing protein [Lactiplantibacillus plantarum]QLK66744.1 DNA replication protein [Lactiplantibacillus plantarum]WKE63368.1 conserved phage C-terminal domain-containing protein [Lactiplantibacillus plantarum]WOD60551.1 conserved phage C-terminal domain-containing protein [Lactiplantibacillus plantarum]WQH17766.1 conserved phage C-terminal domain-containing protein [Lactiplantibacillus plantarum]
MAQRRMFSKKITDTDLFLEMPLSSQALYFHLNMHADDDGFVANAKTIKRMTGASEDDLKILLAKQFIFSFESGVVVIKDWKIHNYIRKDTYNSTIYGDEKKELVEDANGAYTRRGRVVDEPSPQVRLGKDRLGKDSKEHSTADAEQFDWKTVIDYLNQKADKHFKHTDANKRLIIARYKDGGFTVDEMKKVIDNQCAKWLNNPEMNQYLRPVTLFQASKFEGYLNDQSVNNRQPQSREDWFG